MKVVLIGAGVYFFYLSAHLDSAVIEEHKRGLRHSCRVNMGLGSIVPSKIYRLTGPKKKNVPLRQKIDVSKAFSIVDLNVIDREQLGSFLVWE